MSKETSEYIVEYRDGEIWAKVQATSKGEAIDKFKSGDIDYKVDNNSFRNDFIRTEELYNHLGTPSL